MISDKKDCVTEMVSKEVRAENVCNLVEFKNIHISS